MERPDETPAPVDASSLQNAPSNAKQSADGEGPPSGAQPTLLDTVSKSAVAPDSPEITAADVDSLRLALNGTVPPRPLPPTAFSFTPGTIPAPQAAAVLAPVGVNLDPPTPLTPAMFLQPEAPLDQRTLPSPSIRPIRPPLPDRTFERPSLAATRAPTPPSRSEAAPAHPASPEIRAESHPADPLFSEIDREASARSMKAIEAETSVAATDAAPLPPPSKLPASQPDVPIPDLGRQVPRMPRFGTPQSAAFPAIEPLAVDLAARHAGDEATFERSAKSTPRTSILRRILRFALMLALGWLALVLLLIVVFRFVDPPGSSLMLQQWLGGEKITHRWVPIAAVSPQIVRAVVASEDAQFCRHYGIDFGALREAVEDVGTGRVRGASTISMQVTKNLFLWPSKSYLRKVIEFPLTVALETVWPKRRIMEVYLNIAEWGPGIFGIQAASQYHFGKSAGTLTAGEASRLAAALPNPLARNPARPGAGMKRLVRALQVRARAAPASQIACVQPLRRIQ